MSLFTACFENVAVSAAQDLFELAPSDAHVPLVIHSLVLSNVGGTSDAGDAQEEMLRITVRTISGYTNGSGGSSPSAWRVDAGSIQTFNVDVAANNTAVATGTGNNILRAARGWNVRVPFEIIWTPETRPSVVYDSDNGAGTLLVVRLEGSPADSISMSGEITFEELVVG